MSRSRPTLGLALLLVMALVAAACGSDSDDTASGGDGGSGDPVVIDLILTRSYYIPDGFVEAMLEEHNIELIVDVQSNDDILQQLQTRLDAGQELPDLLGAEDSFLMPAFAESGLVGDHADFQAAFEADEPDLYAQLWDDVWTETDGIGASITANFDAFYYNQEWFDEAGVSAPFATFDEVLDGMRALKAARPDGIPLTVQAKAGDGVTTLKTMLAGAGAPFTGAVPDLTSTGGMYTCQWWVDAATEGLTPPDAVAWGEDESRGAFTGGNAAMILDGFTTAGDFNEIEGFDYPDQWNLTPAPFSGGQPGTDGTALAAARTWGIIEGTDNPTEAGLVIRSIAKTEWLVAQANQGGVPARNTDFINSSEALETWPFFNDDLKAAYTAAVPQPAGENAGEVEAILEQFFGEIVSGASSDCGDLTSRYQAELDAA
ncbi:MAG: ABC transporter substrate-binding protein [Acidimicrobiales bacterium]